MTRLLITLTCLFACATLGAAMALFTGWPVAIMGAVVAFLFTQNMSAGFVRRADRKATARELDALRRMSMDMDRALSAASRRMDDITVDIETRSGAQERKIVAELKVLESLMREFAARIAKSARAAQTAIEPAAAAPRQGPVQAYVATLHPGQHDGPHTGPHAGMNEGTLLETIRASLEENRVDLYLQPIVSLPQRKLRYYEALSRLRAEDGRVIMPAEYIKVAAPAGLMSVVDNLLLFRCVQIVRKLTAKSREIGVFCNISGDTLTDAEFFPQFLDYMQANRDLAGQIIFEFSQDAVIKAGAMGEKNLKFLAQLGFALSMDHVETLALDFVRLKNIGFRHLKVRAGTLVGGMNGAGAAVAAEDFKKLLSRHGLNLIAERVEDEKTVVQLLDFTVDFAQGYLFGEPRAVRDDKPESALGHATVLPMRKSA